MEQKIVETFKKVLKEHDIQMVDLKFVDLPGLWQHFSIPAEEIVAFEDLARSIWMDGIGFDGSSIRGFQEIHESDMLLIPDPNRFFIDPACAIPTLSLVCDVYDPVTRQPYSRDPRRIAKKAEAYLKATGIADISYWGPELEFFIFDDIRYAQDAHYGYYFVDSSEGAWNTGREERPNLGYKPRFKEGYFPVPPHDSLQDLRSEIALILIRCGVPIEVHHHEVATAGQGEFDMRYDTLVSMADKVMTYKYIVKNIARKRGKVATFMPKPLFGDNGSGMHTHQSLWKNGTNLFFDPEGYALLSPMALHYIGGLLKHSAALCAFIAPTTNSYKRLVPGYEAPVNLAYSQRNRSAAVRIPVYSTDPRLKRIEYRPPDPTCNPYLSFAALLMAGLDGVENEIDPGEPLDRDIYHLSPEDQAAVPQVPSSLDAALRALEEDHDFLLKGGVFTPDVLETWLQYKREKEVDPVRLRPHPYEFYLYFDI
ncbi:MAG TPA: type I glutamate--ammonia ligase [Dehalococcoidia bacterium]|nr:type I glutamate--ammonia ligase [Dehalococcoidia bacterium]